MSLNMAMSTSSDIHLDSDMTVSVNSALCARETERCTDSCSWSLNTMGHMNMALFWSATTLWPLRDCVDILKTWASRVSKKVLGGRPERANCQIFVLSPSAKAVSISRFGKDPIETGSNIGNSILYPVVFSSSS